MTAAGKWIASLTIAFLTSIPFLDFLLLLNEHPDVPFIVFLTILNFLNDFKLVNSSPEDQLIRVLLLYQEIEDQILAGCIWKELLYLRESEDLGQNFLTICGLL